MASRALSLAVPPLSKRKRIPLRVIRALVQHIAENFDPDEIILFGSHAYGKPEPWSDVDLLVVKDIPEGTEIESALEIYRSLPRYTFGIDILVRSRKVIEWRREQGDWLLREIVREGNVMYRRAGLSEAERLRAELPLAVATSGGKQMADAKLNSVTEEWVALANSDYDAAWLALRKAEVPLAEIAGFHSQQCAEKYLKGYLTEKQVEFPRQHPLIPLMELCVPHDADFESFRGDLDFLEGYAVAVRYPGAKVSVEKAEAAFAAAGRVRAFVWARLGLS